MRKSIGNPVCGTCSGSNYTVSVTVDSSTGCARSSNADSSCMWPCAAIGEFDFGGGDDGADEFLGSVFGNCKAFRKVYCVVNREVGKLGPSLGSTGTHYWIVVGGGLEKGMDAVVARVTETFVKVFVNGGEEGSIREEFMQVGTNGRIVLSFNFLKADPTD